MATTRRVRVVNRVDELVKTLEESFERETIEATLEESARIEASRFLDILKRSAPEGQEEPAVDIYGLSRPASRPSVRQHGITLEKGWLAPRIIRTKKGVHFKISNVAPHLSIILRGAKAHRIFPTGIHDPGLLFHWGSPLRWPEKDRFPAGPRLYKRVEHPGFDAIRFIENALRRKEGRETIKRNFDRTFKTLLNPVGVFFNK